MGLLVKNHREEAAIELVAKSGMPEPKDLLGQVQKNVDNPQLDKTKLLLSFNHDDYVESIDLILKTFKKEELGDLFIAALKNDKTLLLNRFLKLPLLTKLLKKDASFLLAKNIGESGFEMLARHREKNPRVDLMNDARFLEILKAIAKTVEDRKKIKNILFYTDNIDIVRFIILGEADPVDVFNVAVSPNFKNTDGLNLLAVVNQKKLAAEKSSQPEVARKYIAIAQLLVENGGRTGLAK